MTVGQIQVSPPFNIELKPERVCLLQGTVLTSAHHLSLLPYTSYLDLWLHLHVEFHNMENKAERWETNTFDVLILTMVSEFPAVRQEVQKFIFVFLDFYSPLFLHHLHVPSLFLQEDREGNKTSSAPNIYWTDFLSNSKLLNFLNFKSGI